MTVDRRLPDAEIKRIEALLLEAYPLAPGSIVWNGPLSIESRDSAVAVVIVLLQEVKRLRDLVRRAYEHMTLVRDALQGLPAEHETHAIMTEVFREVLAQVEEERRR